VTTAAKWEASDGEPAERGVPIRVLIVEDHAMVAESIARTLAKEPAIEVAGTVGSIGDALASGAEPDVVLLDLRLPDGDGIKALPQLREHFPEAAIVLLSGYVEENLATLAIRSGCAGCISKTDGIDELTNAVHAASRGELAVSARLLPGVLRRLARPDQRTTGDLTPREMEILQLLAQGLAARDIASRLMISRNTVRNHIQNVLVKLHAHTQLEAVAIGLQRGLVTPPR
jgi:DNA-binding NarL/FixJ family response regulator